MERLTIDVGAIVQHYKRNAWLESASDEYKKEEPRMFLYRIEGVAYNTLTGKVDVVYRALYGTNTLYTRGLEDFLYKMDESEHGQGFRFVKYESDLI